MLRIGGIIILDVLNSLGRAFVEHAFLNNHTPIELACIAFVVVSIEGL